MCAELKGRVGLDPNYIVAVKGVYSDTSVDEGDRELVAGAARGLNLEVHAVEGLTNRVGRELAQRSGDRGDGVWWTQGLPSHASDGEHSTKTMKVLPASHDQNYRFLLVLELGDRSLITALTHDYIAGRDLFAVRKIANDIARALDHLHGEGRIHADLKPLNVVRVASRWQLIDLDTSCALDRAFGTKVPSSGYCPPEMAKVLLDARGEDGKVGISKLSAYKANLAYDLWSFGVVRCHLVFGRPLWRTDQNDELTEEDLCKLAGWSPDTLRRQLPPPANCTSDQLTATDLLKKLLVFNPSERCSMCNVLDHPFFQTRSLNDATLHSIAGSVEQLTRSVGDVIGLHKPELVAIAKRATVRIGVLCRDTKKLLEVGSGTILHGGQVLTAAHLFLNAGPFMPVPFPPNWTTPDEPDWIPDWNAEEAPVVLMIGMYQADDLPSRWQYWAELVTPLTTLQTMVDGGKWLQDLAVLHIRGHLEVKPEIFKSVMDEVTVEKKHPPVESIATLALPQAVELSDQDTLISGQTMVTVFGWFAPRNETTLYVPQAQKVISVRAGCIETQALLHSAGSGGGQFDTRGQLVAVNSRSSPDPAIPMPPNYVAYGRLASKLLPEHGLLPTPVS